MGEGTGVRSRRAKRVWTGWHVAASSAERPRPVASPADIAYVIHTSGSTGVPKGIVVQHRPAVELTRWVSSRDGVGPDDRLLFITSPAFDLSVYDVFGALGAGASVHVASEATVRDPEELVRLHRIWMEVRVPTTLIGLQFGAHPERDVYADALRRSIRDIDMVWEIGRDGALTFVVMLPLSGRAALEGYLARIEGLLEERFGKTLDAARVVPYVAQLDDERPAVTLMALLEHCGVK